MDGLISIIVPVYNAEKYLNECIESVLKQTYNNFELLLIDDGSNDSSSKICDDYANQDERVKVVHKQNAGVSAARNTGLDIAKGEYITFIDSDDFVHEDYLKKLHSRLFGDNADLVFCKFAYFEGTQIKASKEKLPKLLLINNDYNFMRFVRRFFSFGKKNLFGGVWRVLYKREIVEGLTFNSEIKVSEDLVFLIKALLKSKRVGFENTVLYFYRQLASSVSKSYKSNFLKSQTALCYEINNIFADLKNRQITKMLKKYFAVLCYYVLSNEFKFKNSETHKNVLAVTESELYGYFKLRYGFKINGLKRKIKFLIVWGWVKTKSY